MPVRAECKPHSPDLKRGALATDARGCSLWRYLLERPPPAPESRVRDPLRRVVAVCGPGGLHNQVYALTTHQLQVERRERHRANQVYALTTHQLQVERRESHRANQVYALTTHQLQVERRESHRDNQVYALTTHQLQVERRERHRDNQVYALTTHQLQVERRESHRLSHLGFKFSCLKLKAQMIN